MNFALNGAASLEANKPAEAIAAYTKALIEHPTSPDYYMQRSTAFTRLSPPRHDLALQDAEKAVLYAYQRSKRNSIQAAQHRRVVSLYNLGRYADAKHILETMRGWVKEDDKKGKMQVDMWMAKAENKLKTATDEQKVFIVEEKPSIQLPTEKERLNLLKRQIHIDGTYNFDWEKRGPSATPEAVDADKSVSEAEYGTPIQPNTSSPSTGIIRHEWYQNAHSVIITLYAKGVPKDKTEIDIQEDSVNICFPHPANPTSSFSFTLDPLFALVDASSSSHRILSTKVEITLQKATQGQKWAALEATQPLTKSGIGMAGPKAKVAIPSTVNQPGNVAGPVYPTSSKSGPKNWDKLASDLTKKKKPGKEGSEHSEDDMKVDSEDESGDAIDGFFKKLFKNSDPDTQRAMMKSFQESNGTALSTNWEEVGKKRVEPVESKAD